MPADQPDTAEAQNFRSTTAPLVFLNTCQASRLSRQRTVAFYDALLADRTMSEAATAGRQAARGADDATWLAYTVYAHPRARLTCDPAATRPLPP